MWKQKKRAVFIFVILFLITIFTVVRIVTSITENKTETISYTQLLQMISKDDVSSIQMQQGSSKVTAFSKTDTTTKYLVEVPNTDALAEYVQEKVLEGQELVISVKEAESQTSFLSSLWSLFIIVNLGYMIYIMVKLKRRMTGKDPKTPPSGSVFSNMFQSDTSFIEKITHSNVNFSDVAGLDEEKEELAEIVDFLKNPEKYRRLGAKIPKGVLLSGPPGTGKTLLAKAIAGEADVAYLAISGSAFIEKYVGVGASRIRELFKEAKRNAPCIIFIDEIDAIGARREDGGDGGNSEHNQTIEQLLTELDGFGTQSNIILLAATNRASSLDPALTRAGRFDRKITIHLPDVKGREEILRIHGRGKPFSESVDFKKIAYNTAGFSGAELANLLNESALIAARKAAKVISNEHIDEALKKITVGIQKTGRVVSEKEKLLVANHEAGHAIVSLFLTTQANVKEVSVIPRGSAGGYTLHETTEDKNYISKTELQERMVVLLAGRVAEQIVLGDISTGASNDLEVATKLARDMITMYGMDDNIGPISFHGHTNTELSIFGDEILSNIGNKVADLLKEAEEKAKNIIQQHRIFLDTVVKELLRQETVSGEYLEELYKDYQKQF